ncbi:MAG: sulfatase [Longimicrobiales bacterium]
MLASLLLPSVLCLGCGGPAPLTVDMPLHLEDHLDAAIIVGSEVPEDVPSAVEWRFDEPQPDWTSARLPPFGRPVQTRTADALRLSVEEAHRLPFGNLLGGSIYVDLPDWKREDWGYVLVRARTSENVSQLRLAFNLRENRGARDSPFRFGGEFVDVINDGSVQTYLLRADWSPPWEGAWEGPWQQLAIGISAEEPAGIDVLSVSVIPKEANYAAAPAGVRTEVRNNAHRRTLYTHAPGRLEYRVRVPEAGRLDLGLGVLRDDDPVTFRITATPSGGEEETLLEVTYADQEQWAQHAVDLSHLSGQTVTLALEVDAERAGAVALWTAPTVTRDRSTEKPNIIFYIIDGGAADYMSVYGYNRRTTPNLERLAAEGAVFEHAYSNASWTRPSTASFMTSLHSSVLGGIRGYAADPVPEQAVTMAEHMHRAGYQTAVFVSNPYAGSLSNLERGVDVFRDAGVTPNSGSSAELHQDYWRWREAYPAEPYWVHFQTTDVHPEFDQRRDPVAPFAGLFSGPELRETYYEWERQLAAAAGFTHTPWLSLEAIDKSGISYAAFFNAARSLYDENMAHQDYQLGRLVERLKARGEWGHTLVIVAADHASAAAHVPDPFPPGWGPMFRSSVTRIPLIVVWPERIAPGQRFSQPVSMIDMLPTILDLAGLPMPEVMQGQSLAPLLLGEEGWEARPVILDEFGIEDTGELSGYIEVIDGRWGASLLINPSPSGRLSTTPDIPKSRVGDGYDLLHRRPVPLLLYDLWNDPYTQHSLHEERPDLVEKYTKFLEAQFEAHQSLAQLFTHSADQVALTPEQLRTLRALGYIQ